MEFISAKEARDRLSDVINKVVYSGERFTITRHGHGVAVLISLKEWQAIETLLQKAEDKEDAVDENAVYQSHLKDEW